MITQSNNSGQFAPSLLSMVMVCGKEKAALSLIGELMRDGQTVYYVNEVDRVGRYTGKVIEGNKFQLVRLCIQNNYV
jgi:hypothetical protein